jgi:hypothetical protein
MRKLFLALPLILLSIGETQAQAQTTLTLGSATATTQSAADNSTKVATTAYADRAATSPTLPATTCTNQFITAIATSGAGTCTTATLASGQFANQGTTTTLLHGNAAGNPSFGSVVSADLNVTPSTCTNQFLSAISSTLGGTCTTATLASAQFANQGTTTTVLHGNGAGNPSFGSVVSADLNLTTTTCSNQFITAISATGTGTCTTATLTGAQFANQGTTTTLLHGNGAGNPSFGAVVLTTDVSGVLPIANGGSGNTGANTYFQDFPGGSVNGGVGGVTQNQIRLNAVYLPSNTTLSNIAYESATADNTANSYDIGAYGPGCLAGTASIPLAFHTGTLAGTVLFPSSGNFFSHAITGGPVTVAQGWYCFAFTSNAATPLAVIGGNTGGTAAWSAFASNAITGGGAVLPSTITAPATAFANHNSAFMVVY